MHPSMHQPTIINWHEIIDTAYYNEVVVLSLKKKKSSFTNMPFFQILVKQNGH